MKRLAVIGSALVISIIGFWSSVNDNALLREVNGPIPVVSMGQDPMPSPSESVETKWIYHRDLNDGKFKAHHRHLINRRLAIHGVKIDRLTLTRRGASHFVVEVHVSKSDEERVAALKNPFGFSSTTIWRGDRQLASVFGTRRSMPLTIWYGSKVEADQLMDDFLNAQLDRERIEVEFPAAHAPLPSNSDACSGRSSEESCRREER